MSDVGGGNVTAVAEVLARHTEPFAGVCACGWRSRLHPFQPGPEMRAHVAEQIAPLIAAREAAAEQRGREAALREAADDIDTDDELALNHILGGASYTMYWLRERADRQAHT